MRHAPDGSLQLSSRLTPLIRGVFPIMWLALLGLSVFETAKASLLESLVPLGVLVAGFLWFRATAFQLCEVWADRTGLIVKRGSQRAHIPYAAIRDARQHHYFGFSEVLFDGPSPFGRVILFVPYLAQVFPFLAEHPADVLIQHRAAEAAGHRGA
jgi:hypothetical protein